MRISINGAELSPLPAADSPAPQFFEERNEMKTVSEIIYGERIYAKTKEEQDDYIGAIRKAADAETFNTVREINNRIGGKIKNCGETSILELMAAMGIWLSQFTEAQVEQIQKQWERRPISEAVWAVIGNGRKK